MKVHVLSEQLQKHLPFLNHAISTKSQLPILLNFLLETTPSELIVSATDLEIGIQTRIPANIEEEGGITVPAKLFAELVASLPDEKISLVTTKELLEVKSKKSKSTFQTIAKDEFPSLYKELGDKIYTFPKDLIEKEFSKVVFAASNDATRPALSAVYIKKEEDGSIILVATDGYRLSLKRFALSAANKDNKQLEKPLLVPARALKEVIAVKDGSTDIALHVVNASNQVLFTQGGTTIVARLIESEFPNYERIIPTDASTFAEVDRNEMQKAVKTCAIFARETANIIKLSIQKDKIVVSANTPSLGENSVEVDAKITGEENEIAFNARYLLDVFTHLVDDDIVFEMTGPLNPGVFKLKGDASFLHLIMPIRVQE